MPSAVLTIASILASPHRAEDPSVSVGEGKVTPVEVVGAGVVGRGDGFGCNWFDYIISSLLMVCDANSLILMTLSFYLNSDYSKITYTILLSTYYFRGRGIVLKSDIVCT